MTDAERNGWDQRLVKQAFDCATACQVMAQFSMAESSSNVMRALECSPEIVEYCTCTCRKLVLDAKSWALDDLGESVGSF